MSLKVMADNHIEISAKQDGALYNIAMSDQDFVIGGIGNELSMSYTGLQVTIETGEAVIHGRHVTAQEQNTINLPANESGYLVLRIDLSQPIGEEALFYATPTLTHQEINWQGTVYDMPIATFSTNNIEITNFEDVRTIKSDSIPDNVAKKEYVDEKIGEVNADLSQLEIKVNTLNKIIKTKQNFATNAAGDFVFGKFYTGTYISCYLDGAGAFYVVGESVNDNGSGFVHTNLPSATVTLVVLSFE